MCACCDKTHFFCALAMCKNGTDPGFFCFGEEGGTREKCVHINLMMLSDSDFFDK